MIQNQSEQAQEESVLFNQYDREVHQHNWQYNTRKARNNLLIMAALFFIGDFVALAQLNQFELTNVIAALIVPALYTALAFIALKAPKPAMLAALALLLLIVAFNVYVAGAVTLITGWLWKAAVVYLMITGFRYANEANEAKRQLVLMQ